MAVFDSERYRGACDRLTLSPEGKARILSAAGQRKGRRLSGSVRTVLVVAALVAVLGVTALAANSEAVRKLLWSKKGSVTIGGRGYDVVVSAAGDGAQPAGMAGSGYMLSVDRDGECVSFVLPDLSLTRRDGRSILRINGDERDITDALNEEGYYEQAVQQYVLRVDADGTAVLRDESRDFIYTIALG